MRVVDHDIMIARAIELLPALLVSAVVCFLHDNARAGASCRESGGEGRVIARPKPSHGVE